MGCPVFWTYMLRLMGKVQYVLQIEPENLWFKDAQKKLLAYIYEHYNGLFAAGKNLKEREHQERKN